MACQTWWPIGTMFGVGDGLLDGLAVARGVRRGGPHDDLAAGVPFPGEPQQVVGHLGVADVHDGRDGLREVRIPPESRVVDGAVQDLPRNRPSASGARVEDGQYAGRGGVEGLLIRLVDLPEPASSTSSSS